MVRGSSTRVLLAASGLLRCGWVPWGWWSSRRIELTRTGDFDSPRGRRGCSGAGHRVPAAAPALASPEGHGGAPRPGYGPGGPCPVAFERRLLHLLPRPV